jgi:hypothetical protein
MWSWILDAQCCLRLNAFKIAKLVKQVNLEDVRLKLTEFPTCKKKLTEFPNPMAIFEHI